MSDKRVAGTIMLNLNDGSKKFLVHPVKDKAEFVTTQVLDGMTGLASILQLFKENIHLDVTSISLVELTNVHNANEDMPLFVFEMNEAITTEIKNQDYAWEVPAQLKSLLSAYDIEGVPMF